MQGLLKLIMNSLYRAHIRKDINESNCCKSEHWKQTEYDENVLEYCRLPNGNYIVKMKKKTTERLIMLVILKTVYLPISEFLF